MSQQVVTVEHIRDSAFELEVRGHRVTVDQPHVSGGEDLGATPTELFVGSLAACVAHYAAGYLRRHGIVTNLTVTAHYTLVDRPARLGDLEIRIAAPGLPAAERPRLLAVARHCTLHNTLADPPSIDVDFETLEPSVPMNVRSA